MCAANCSSSTWPQPPSSCTSMSFCGYSMSSRASGTNRYLAGQTRECCTCPHEVPRERSCGLRRSQLAPSPHTSARQRQRLELWQPMLDPGKRFVQLAAGGMARRVRVVRVIRQPVVQVRRVGAAMRLRLTLRISWCQR